MMLTLSNISLQRGKKILFQEAHFSLFAKQKVGLIGNNGTGKTSLFALFQKKLEPSSGNLFLPTNIKIVSIEQEIPFSTRSALDFVIDADIELRDLESQLEKSQEENESQKIGVLYARLEDIDGFSATARAAKILNGLGFTAEQMEKTVNHLSGGWRVRLNIARALFVPSDILLLDEPTNHLDLDSVIWLERWLMQYEGMLLLISHDRDFLDQIVSKILHIENQQIELYTGNYSAFEKIRAEKLSLQQKGYEKQQKQITHLQSYIDRFRAKASKAKQAQSRIKSLERMQQIMPAHIDTPFSFEFKEATELPSPFLKIEDVDFSYGDHSVFKGIHFQLSAFDRIGLLGVNGAGKSTLIKLIAKELNPNHGSIHRFNRIKIGYFAQHSLEKLHEEQSALWHLHMLAPSEKELVLRKYLGSFAFTHEMTLMPVKDFSGGEKARLALALIVWQAPNCLLLDEPTNHLDLDMRQALILALQNYSGAVIVVSHDRFLLKNIVDDFYLVSNQSVDYFDGDLEDYQKEVLRKDKNTIKIEKKEENKVSRKDLRQASAAQREQAASRKKQIGDLEKKIEKEQKKLLNIDALLADEQIHFETKKEELKNLLMERGSVSKTIQQLEDQWLSLSGEI